MEDTFTQEVREIFRIRRKYAIYFSLAFITGLLFGFNEENVFSLLYGYIAFPFGLWVLLKWFRLGWYLRRNVWDIFIEKNNIQVMSKSDRPVHGVLSALGDYYNTRVIFEGLYNDRHIRVFTQTVSYNAKASWLTRNPVGDFYSYMVFEIITDKRFHHVFLDSKLNNKIRNQQMRTIRSSIKDNPTIKTDGNVHEYFDAYVPPNSSFNGLITLTPDVLIILRDFAKPFDIEFIGSSIYIITDDKLKKIDDIMVYQDSLIKLVEALSDNLVRRPDVSEEPMKINKYKALIV